MPVINPVLIKMQRPPFAKPSPGTPINWDHPLSKYLVASWPFNECRGHFIREYARAGGEFSVGPRNFTTMPVWNTEGKVPCYDTDLAAGGAGPALWQTGAYYGQLSTKDGNVNFPGIDFSKGFTIQCWAQLGPSASSQAYLFSINDAGDLTSLCYILAEQFFGKWRYRLELQSRTPHESDSPVYDVTVGSLPNQIVVTYERLGTNSWTLRAWDANETLIIDNAGTGDYPAGGGGGSGYGGYQVGGFMLGGAGSTTDFGKYQLFAFNVWNRPLGEGAVKSLIRDPLQMYAASSTSGMSASIPDPFHNPPVVSLTALPTTIREGNYSTLSWTSAFADALTIDQGIGAVTNPSGSMNVYPIITTTYTITATNAYGTATASAIVTVTPRGASRPLGRERVILQRDLTKFSDAALTTVDDGTPYTAFATIGSVVLCHPSELAMALFLTLESAAVGSHPGVSILLDEVAASIAVPFADLGPYVPDPPILVAPQTLYSDRFYVSHTQQPAICRHMQVKVAWPAEAAANELLSWSVIGAHVSERG
jgi:hypothetical protein